MNETPITINHLQFDLQDVSDISSFLNLDEDYVLNHLINYQPSEMANDWRRNNPKTARDMRNFYAKTELYIWELTKWHTSSLYEFRIAATKFVLENYPKLTHPRVLDYGCGIGTISLNFAEKDYQTTIADIPGRTLEYAKYRFSRRNLPVKVYDIKEDFDVPNEPFDIIICVDVLEHLSYPVKTIHRLARILRPGGLAVVFAAWDRNENYPHHLEDNCRLYGDTGNWWVYMNAEGLSEIHPLIYLKTGGIRLLARKIRFQIWKSTGYFLTRIPRFPEDR